VARQRPERLLAGLGHGGLLGHAGAQLSYPQLADRHKIIGNNWQNAAIAQLVARYLGEKRVIQPQRA